MKKSIVALFISFFLIAGAGTCFAADNAGKINLNTATKAQLVELGMNEGMATAVLELREENGEFVDMDELMDVDGIDAKMIRKLKQKAYIEGAKGCNC